MPTVNLPTGANLYYETHGQGEPLVLVPSTAFSCEVWKPSQMALANSTQLIIHDPRGCGRTTETQKDLHHQSDGQRHRRAARSSQNSVGPPLRPLHGRAHRLGNGA